MHLVGGLAPAALAAHAVGHHAQGATGHAAVGDDLHLVLLVGAVAPVHAGGGRNPERLFWCCHAREYKLAGMAQSPQIDDNLHSVQRQSIELRMEHADLDDMIDRLALSVPTTTWRCGG